MFFTGMIVFGICALTLPWYGLCAVATLIGFAMTRNSWTGHLVLAASAGLMQAAAAFVADGRNYGIISQRMAGLFSLPSSYLMFAVMFALAFVTALLWLRAGVFLRSTISR